jgi:hypothetical protein
MAVVAPVFGHAWSEGVPKALGACQFPGVSGWLKGFKADVTVTTVDFTIWHWNGAVSSRRLTSRGCHVRDNFSA